jgi:hypothetical protein
MSNFLWVKTEKRQSLLDSLDSIPEIGKKSKSVILELALEEFVKKHAVSNNPQTTIMQFDKESILAVPNIYRDSKSWKKFYKNVKTKKEYKEIDKALNMILNIHNRKNKEF